MTMTREKQSFEEVLGMNEAPESASPAFLEALAGLDEDTAEAVQERAAILQFEAGLSRADAERTALAAYAPKARDGIEDLKDFLAREIPLIGIWPDSGASIEPWSNRENFTRDAEELSNLWEGRGNARGIAKGIPIRRFAFVPGESGFICLDLDRGHNGGADGVASLYEVFTGRPIPRYFTDIDQGSFPAYTRTPGGGFHLYFRYTGTRKYRHQSIAPGLEVVHFNHLLTAPGSKKETGRYIFFGSLDAAPLFPPVLEWRLSPTDEFRPKHPPKPVFSDTLKRDRPDLDRIAQWTLDDGRYAGRNDLCYGIAFRAAREEYGYSREEVKAFLRSYGPVDGLPVREIESAVDSAFNRRRRA